jgi:hypothetical protein
VLLLIVFYYNNLNLKSKSTHLEDKVNRISLNLNLMKNFLDDLKETTRQLNETLNNIFKLAIPAFFNNITEHNSNKINDNDQDLKPNVKIFDLKKPLEPITVYSPIKCRTSANFYSINTTLCIHDLNRDVFVSEAIWKEGIWEGNTMSILLFLI